MELEPETGGTQLAGGAALKGRDELGITVLRKGCHERLVILVDQPRDFERRDSPQGDHDERILLVPACSTWASKALNLARLYAYQSKATMRRCWPRPRPSRVPSVETMLTARGQAYEHALPELEAEFIAAPDGLIITRARSSFWSALDSPKPG